MNLWFNYVYSSWTDCRWSKRQLLEETEARASRTEALHLNESTLRLQRDHELAGAYAELTDLQRKLDHSDSCLRQTTASLEASEQSLQERELKIRSLTMDAERVHMQREMDTKAAAREAEKLDAELAQAHVDLQKTSAALAELQTAHQHLEAVQTVLSKSEEDTLALLERLKDDHAKAAAELMDRITLLQAETNRATAEAKNQIAEVEVIKAAVAMECKSSERRAEEAEDRVLKLSKTLETERHAAMEDKMMLMQVSSMFPESGLNVTSM